MTDTMSVEAFQAEAKAFFDANAEPRGDEQFQWGVGPDRAGILDEKTTEQELADLAAAKEWRGKLFDAGLAWLSGPKEFGGRELSTEHERAFAAIEAAYRFPAQSQFGIGLGMIAPTILAHATPEVRDRYLRGVERGDILACQLFSEPIAGSDLAGIQTRAIRDGDEWIINGQKVWTSGAQYSDIGEIITRTSPDKPKHRGMTMFLVDMHAPGVEVRPLRQITGGASFNEVFLTNVRVPDSHRLGDVDNGWSVALTTLMNERASIGGSGGGFSFGTARLVETARHLDRLDDPIVRQGIADVVIRNRVAALNNQRAMAKILAGQLPGPEMSIAKLSLTQNGQRLGDVLTNLIGSRIVADTGEWGMYAANEIILGIPGMRVAGGTDEIMKNIVAERVLGLPKEPRIDAHAAS
ncbi:MAG: acyl-CoA dehydrogenase [Actinomycetia bacterium]|nr:acyl-CoA dehydrogenase [Actinomycetes bacterium]